MYEITEKNEKFTEGNIEKRYNKKKNHNRNFKGEEKVETETIETIITEENKEEKPIETKKLNKGTIVHIGKYAAMVKIGEKNFVMKPEFVKRKVGDIVEF